MKNKKEIAFQKKLEDHGYKLYSYDPQTKTYLVYFKNKPFGKGRFTIAELHSLVKVDRKPLTKPRGERFACKRPGCSCCEPGEKTKMKVFINRTNRRKFNQKITKEIVDTDE